jgi:hypothetical protein
VGGGGGAAHHGYRADFGRGSLRDPQPPIDPDAAAAWRVERRLEHQRLNFVCRQAMRQFFRPQKTVTRKTGTRGENAIDEKTVRVQSPNLQCLKVILQATSRLSQLEDKAQLPTDEPASGAAGRQQVEAWLNQQRQAAVQAGKIPDAIGHYLPASDLIDTFLGESKHNAAVHALAHDAGKKIVNQKPDYCEPPIPKRNGWYYPLRDSDGDTVAWLRAQDLEDALSKIPV